MIPVITDWVKNIVLVVLFASFLELLLPNGSMQRFIRVIMGLFIMLAILNPVIDAIQNPGMEEEVPALSTSSGNAPAIVAASHAMVKEREQLSNELFRKELSQQIKAIVIALEGVADAKVQVDIYTEPISNKRAGTIKSVVVYVQPGSPAGSKKIARVSIGNQITEEKMQVTPQLENRIKLTISELYQLSKEQIDIKLLP
ncbi:MAG TPA: stage III sporulation protein AF [Negativicutes bacterium]